MSNLNLTAELRTQHAADRIALRGVRLSATVSALSLKHHHARRRRDRARLGAQDDRSHRRPSDGGTIDGRRSPRPSPSSRRYNSGSPTAATSGAAPKPKPSSGSPEPARSQPKRSPKLQAHSCAVASESFFAIDTGNTFGSSRHEPSSALRPDISQVTARGACLQRCRLPQSLLPRGEGAHRADEGHDSI